MIRTVLVGVTALVMSLWMPVLLLTPEEPIVDDKLLIIETEAPAKKETMILLKTEGKIVEMPVEEYLVGVLLSEMPASFEMEALKAQAVAARTFTLRQMAGGKHEDCHLCADSGCCQAWTSSARLSEKLGEQYRKKAELAVDMTEGEVLLYEGELIDAVYFSCSGGATEDAVAVFSASQYSCNFFISESQS